MERFWLYILKNKANPIVWPVLLVFAIGALLYRIGLAINSLSLTRKIKTAAKVVSVGNITVGGSGKTPITIELTEYYLSGGKKTAVASGGYKRRDNSTIHGTGREVTQLPIEQTGDELMLMAERLPEAFFAVAGSKHEAAKLLDEKYRPDIILVDDGFQHRRLHRDLDILLIDAAGDITTDHLFPLGRLREPFTAAGRADLIILTKTNLGNQTEGLYEIIRSKFPGTPIMKANFHNKHIISDNETLDIQKVNDRSVYFFAGVAGYDTLLKRLNDRFANLLGHRAFSDHCPYPEPERNLIIEDINRFDPEITLTTKKDWVKIRNFDFGRTIYYLDLQLEFDPDGRKKLFDRLDGLVKQ